MTEVKIAKYNDRYYIRSSMPYFINITGTDKVLTNKNDTIVAETYDKTNKNQRIYIWQCMDGTHDFILQPVDNDKVFNVNGGFDSKSSIQPTAESGPNLILYNKISKFSSTCYSTPISNLQDNNLFWNNDNNGGYIIPTVTTVKSVNSQEYLSYNSVDLFMGLSASNVKYVDNNENIVNYPGNNKDRKNVTKNGDYFTINTGGEYQMYRSKKSYYIKSGSFVFDVTNGNKDNGTKVQLYTFNGTAAQQWYLWKDNFNRYGFQNVNSNKWLDLPDGNKIKSGQKNPIQMQIYTDVSNKTIHRNQLYSVTQKENNRYYIQNTYCSVLDWVIAGLANNQGSAVALHEKGKDNYVCFSTNGTDDISLSSIEFEIPSYEKFNVSQYYVYSEEELKGKEYEFGELKTPKFDKELTFSKLNSTQISASDISTNFFNTIDKACVENGKQLNIKFKNGEVLTKINIKPKTETNLMNLQELQFRFQYDGITKTFLYNWAKLLGLRESKTNSPSLLNLFTYFSNMEETNPNFLIQFSDHNSDFINKILSRDTKELELLGWNRYRPETASEINSHISYLNYALTMFINGVLNKNLNNENINLNELFKNMFIDVNSKKVYDYVLYTGLFAQLLKLYNHEFLDYVPQQNIQNLIYLPYWNTNDDYFADTSKDVETAWTILNPNKNSNNIPTTNEKNVISTPNDYNNIFQIYNGNKNLSHKLINISPKENKNEEDFKNSYDKLLNSIESVVYKIVDNNFKPIHKNLNESELNYVISKEPKFENYIIGLRYKGCKVGKGRKWYGVKIGVTKTGYLENNGEKRVNCGKAAGLDSSESDGPHIKLRSKHLLPLTVKVAIYLQDNFGGKLINSPIDTFELDPYNLEYVDNYGGINEGCNKNKKCAWNEPTGDAFGCSRLRNPDIKSITYNCNFNKLTRENYITIGGIKYNIDTDFQSELNKLTNNVTFNSELLSNDLITNTLDGNNTHCYHKDTWWIRDKSNSGDRYIKGMFDKNNNENKKDDSFGSYFGTLLEFKNAFYIGEEEKYMGNPGLENKTCPDVDSDVSQDASFTKSSSNDLARCFVKTKSDNIIMRIFDSRVEQLIYDIIDKHSTIFTNDLENEILSYFKENPLQLIPYRVIKNYIPYNTILDINQPIRSNLENLLGPILINVSNPVLVQYHNYISNFVDNYKFMDLKSNNYQTNSISQFSINNNYTHYLDKMMYELNHAFSNLGDFNNKAVVLTLFVNYYNIYNYISTDLDQNLYNIQICDTSSENNREDNKEHIAYNLKHMNSDCVKLIMTNSELKGLDKVDLKSIATHDLPFVNCYNKKYNIENLEQQTDNDDLDSFFSYTFKYGSHKMYLYTQQAFNSITSYASSDKLSQNGSISKNEGLEAYNIRVTIDPSLNSSASWLQPNWNTEENILDVKI